MPGVSMSLKPLGKPNGIRSKVVPGRGERVAPPTARFMNRVPKCLRVTTHPQTPKIMQFGTVGAEHFHDGHRDVTPVSATFHQGKTGASSEKEREDGCLSLRKNSPSYSNT